jgi:hypothetical protein
MARGSVVPIGYTPKKRNTKRSPAKVHKHLSELYNRLANNGIPFNISIHKNLVEQANHLNTLLERQLYPLTTRKSMRELGRVITAGQKKLNKLSPKRMGCFGRSVCRNKTRVTPF